MRIGRMRLVTVKSIVIMLLALATTAGGPLAAEGTIAVAQASVPAPGLDCVDLAAMHLEYLLLEEVQVGQGPDGDAEIALAAAHLDYLLLPETALDGACTPVITDS